MKWIVLGIAATGIGVCAQSAPLDVSAYKSWKRLTAKPAYMPDPVAIMCAAPSPALVADPHRGRLIHVYVNPIGEKEAVRAYKAVKEDKVPKDVKFPEGTVIVKTKFSDRDPAKVKDPTIELMTVMIKQAKGKSPKTGDWRFAVMDGTGKKLLDDKRQEMCWSCHQDMKNDHVSLRYQTEFRLK